MATFKLAEVFFGDKTNGTSELPEGFTMGFIYNNGTTDVTLTGSTGTFTFSANEKIRFESVGKPYAAVPIDASSGSVKFGYVKS